LKSGRFIVFPGLEPRTLKTPHFDIPARPLLKKRLFLFAENIL